MDNPKPISLKDLSRLKGAGAKVEHEPRHVTVRELPALIGQIQRLAQSLEHNKKQDIAGQLGELTRAIGKMQGQSASPDLKQLFLAIGVLHASIAELLERPAPAYTFTVKRDESGRMVSVKAEPSQ